MSTGKKLTTLREQNCKKIPQKKRKKILKYFFKLKKGGKSGAKGNV